MLYVSTVMPWKKGVVRIKGFWEEDELLSQVLKWQWYRNYGGESGMTSRSRSLPGGSQTHCSPPHPLPQHLGILSSCLQPATWTPSILHTTPLALVSKIRKLQGNYKQPFVLGTLWEGWIRDTGSDYGLSREVENSIGRRVLQNLR